MVRTRINSIHLGRNAVRSAALEHCFSHFQTECGCEFTKKLVVMFKDIQVSATTNEEFKRHVQATSVRALNVEFFSLEVFLYRF